MKSFAKTLLISVVLLLGPLCALPSFAASTTTATPRDGHKDFDFLFGTWYTHYKILRHPLSNSHDWYDCNGKSVIRPFWDGSGNLEDGDLHCPTRYVGGMTLRLYNAATHEWSLYWGTRKLGLVLPAQVGHFDANGVGDFFADDTYSGKKIIVRFRWSAGSNGHPRFEQAFSADKGKTWETNWTTDYTHG